MNNTIVNRVKDTLKAALYRMGWVIYRRPDNAAQTEQLPPLLQDPFEALHFTRSGINVAFECPLNKCVLPLGWGYSVSEWAPHVEAAREIAAGRVSLPTQSVLKAYYDIWQPASAGETLPNLELRRSKIAGLPGYAIRCSPWRAQRVDKILEQLNEWWENDAEEHLGKRLSIHQHGTKMYGPVSSDLLGFEYQRLSNLVDVFKRTSYDRSHGHIQVSMLRRDNEVRFLKTSRGYHRAAVLAALGHATVPATFRIRYPNVIDIRDVADWPLVRRGVWDRDEAEQYFHHLFDFDSRAWARERGLIFKSGSTYTVSKK